MTTTNPVLWEHEGKYYDCVYSPDDSGYYLQRHEDNASSEVFEAACQAWDALTTGDIHWEAT